MIQSIKIHHRTYSKEDILQLSMSNIDNSLLYDTMLFLKEWFSDDKYIVLQTSGSTAKPKKIEVRREQMLQSAQRTLEFLQLKEGNTALLCLSPKFIAGKMMIVRALFGGLHLFVSLSEKEPLKSLESNIDFAAMVPLQFLRLAQNEAEKLQKIQTLLLGGAALSPEIEKIATSFETQIFHTYGMTETLSHIALRKISGYETAEFFHLLDGIQIAQDERGCLKVKAAYLNDEWLQTNDKVELLDKNRFIVLGRMDDIINMSGLKLFPQQIERKIASFCEFNFAIVGISDERSGQLPVMVIEADLSTKKLFELWNELEGRLQANEMPRKIVLFESFPMLESGKIDFKSIKNSLEK